MTYSMEGRVVELRLEIEARSVSDIMISFIYNGLSFAFYFLCPFKELDDFLQQLYKLLTHTPQFVK